MQALATFPGIFASLSLSLFRRKLISFSSGFFFLRRVGRVWFELLFYSSSRLTLNNAVNKFNPDGESLKRNEHLHPCWLLIIFCALITNNECYNKIALNWQPKCSNFTQLASNGFSNKGNRWKNRQQINNKSLSHLNNFQKLLISAALSWSYWQCEQSTKGRKFIWKNSICTRIGRHE